MRGDFSPVRLIFLCVVVSVISGCSVQRPDAGLDSSRSKGKERIDNSAYRAVAPQKEPVRVDYLTLLSEVSSPEVYVYKEKRRLYVVQSNVVVRDYPINLGPNPVGDKQIEGDGRTPEGDFTICEKTPGDRINKALVIDYPDRGHAKRALFSGIISPLQFKQIALAAASKAAPPWDTKLGGQIAIHAEGGQGNAAHGDIELYSSDMKELFKVASPGTPVHIRP
ncbi:MAG: L,D-transpeptidase [Syntrophobacteraceae bacterium]|nr:L,D-transpeptidase [Syntrophobacteraceae bacterium]